MDVILSKPEPSQVSERSDLDIRPIIRSDHDDIRRQGLRVTVNKRNQTEVLRLGPRLYLSEPV